MTVAYVTMPGTSGNYVSSADVNLLDADTAHMQQGDGLWDVVFNLTRAYAAFTGSPIGDFGVRCTFTSASAAVIRTGKNVVPVSAATQYSYAAWVYAETDAVEAQLVIDQYDNVSGGTYIGGATIIAPAVTIPQGTGVWLTMTQTSHASAASWDLKVQFPTSGAGHAISDIVWLGAAVLRTGAVTTFVPSTRIVGDLDMRARFAATDATPAAAKALIGQRSGNSGYAMTLGTGGELVVYHGTGAGTRLETSSGLTLVAATDTVVRSVIDISAGTWTHYKNGVQFDTSGSFATTAGSPFAGPLAVGADSAGTSGNWAGDIYYCEVRDGIDGPVVRRVDADDLIGLV